MFPSRAEHILHFGVVGGSISGLSAAYWLRQAGHIVTVLEKHSMEVFQNQKFSGLRIPPNITRLFRKIDGMEKMFEERASPNIGSLFYQEETGEMVGRMLYEEEIMADLGSKYYRIPYLDLWDHLYELCRACDVTFKFEFQVAGGVFGNEPPKVISTIGEEYSCDLIIGADGHNSVIRELVLSDLLRDEDSESEGSDEAQRETEFPDIKEWVTCRFSIPLDRVEGDRDLEFLAKNYLAIMWMGNGVAHFSGREGNEQYEINVFYPFRRFGSEDMDWNVTEPVPVNGKEIKGTECELVLRKLLNLASSCHRSNQKDYQFSHFVNKTHQIVIIGDAAHSALINGPQNTGIAVEDGFMLGLLFSKLNSLQEISFLLNGFNDIRRKRTQMIRDTDFHWLHVLSFPPRPQRHSRNEAFKQTLKKEGVSDEQLAQLWSEFLTQCNYDAQGAVEEWWHNWGRLMRRSSGDSK